MNKFFIPLLILILCSCSRELIRYHGHDYKVIITGRQRWMAENLQTNRYRSGIRIPVIKDCSAWPELSSRACGYYNNDSTKLKQYGMFYNWHAVERGKLCPLFWKVPSDDDWNTLELFLGGEKRAGGKMKSLKGWKGRHISGDDIGFGATAGGYRLNDDFQEGFATVWWSSTRAKDKEIKLATTGNDSSLFTTGQIWIWGRRIESYSSQLWTTVNRPNNGFYIRCVRKK